MNALRKIHPIVEQLQPSPEQEPAILSEGKDIVVTAGAGTGKTRTLVARFLSLLAEGIPLRAIVAITFTVKAAREMRNRLREEVRTYLLSGDLSEEERWAWQSIYEGIDAARVSTIHSFAADILRQHPAEMGLDPEFDLLDEGESSRMKGLAVEAALAWGGSDQEASGLFPVFGAWKLRRILAELLNKRLEVADALDTMPVDLWSVWEPYLRAPLQRFVEDPLVQAGLDELAALKTNGSLARAEAAGDRLVEDLRIVIEAWESIQSASSEDDWVAVSRSIGRLGNHLKQKGKKENWAPTNPRQIIKEIQDIFKETFPEGELDLAVDKALASEIIPHLRRLFEFATQWYAAAREQINGLDFDDLEEKILLLLTTYPDVLAYWQHRIQALLVDEYQDTNGRQRELVNLLNGGQERLFIVGDGKQSIYRFRGADVAVFREEQTRISQEGESFHLNTSYRSHPKLLHALNRMLAPVLGDRADLAYIEPFSELQPGRDHLPRIDLPAYVEFHLAVGSKSGGAGRLAAQATADRLRDIIEGNKALKNRSLLDYGDAAVLCRATSSFSDFEAAFEFAGIPYTTISGQGFYERPEVRDVMNALQAFMDPHQDLALAGLMRSPVCGFADGFLLDLRDFQHSGNHPSMFDAAQAYGGKEGGEAPEGLNEFIGLVNEFSSLAGRVTAAELISRFLARTNYLAGLTMAGQERSVSNLRKLVADAQASGIVNLSDFLNAIQEIRSVAVRESEAILVSEGAVQIMTVHQAKGLEFPIVILGDATKKDRFTRDILIDERFGLIPPYSAKRVESDSSGELSIRTGTSYAYELALEDERLKEDAESNRLLYVAATRAQELLILSGPTGNPTRESRLPGLTGWMGKVAGPVGLGNLDLEVDPEGTGIHRLQMREGDLQTNLFVYESNLDFSALAAREKPGLEKVSTAPALWERVSRQIEPDSQPAKARKAIYPISGMSSPAHVPARIVGDVVHHALELWKFPTQSETDFTKWVKVEFNKEGIFETKAIQAGYRRVRRMLERFLATELFQRMDGADVLLHEVPFSILGSGNSPLTGSIDALFREGDQWTLVEFKTDQIKAGAEIDWKAVDYQEQVEDYLAAVEQIIQQRPIPILCFLDYGGRVKLITDRW